MTEELTIGEIEDEDLGDEALDRMNGGRFTGHYGAC